MTQTASKQRVKPANQTKQTSVATPKGKNEVSANIPEISTGKKKKPTSTDADTSTEPISNKRTNKRSAKSELNSQPLIESGMEVICSQTKFHDALSLVSCATPAKPTHPILANALIIADIETQQIHLTVTDLALTIQASFEAQVLLKGEITVPVEMLFEIVKHCPNGNISLSSQTQIIQLIDEEKQTKICSLSLSDADGKYEIRGISAEDFPPSFTIDATPIPLPTTVFKDGLKGVIYAVSTDENKYILTGVHIQLAQEKLKFIGTDGHRVATKPAKDIYHNEVKNALIKDGWTITDDPYFIKYEDAELYADLAAEKPIAAERQGQKIVVEIKSFVGKSLMYDFHNALGQYIVYRKLIQLTEPEYKLYLAVDDVVYENFFQRKSVQAVINENHLLLIVVNTQKEEIRQWIS